MTDAERGGHDTGIPHVEGEDLRRLKDELQTAVQHVNSADAELDWRDNPTASDEMGKARTVLDHALKFVPEDDDE